MRRRHRLRRRTNTTQEFSVFVVFTKVVKVKRVATCGDTDRSLVTLKVVEADLARSAIARLIVHRLTRLADSRIACS